MSEVEIVAGSKSSSGKPLITYNGSLELVIELPPLTTIFKASPGVPSLELTFTPAILPVKASSKLATTAVCNSSVLTVETEPVKSFLATEPYPITTTSSSCAISDFKVTFIIV